MGLFLARLLTAEPAGRIDAADYLRELLQSESDPWTTLALPMLEFGERARRDAECRGRRADRPQRSPLRDVERAARLADAAQPARRLRPPRALRAPLGLQAQLAAPAHAVRLLRAPRSRRVTLVGARGSRAAAADPARPLRRDAGLGGRRQPRHAASGRRRDRGRDPLALPRARRRRVRHDRQADRRGADWSPGLGDRVAALYGTYCDGGTEPPTRSPARWPRTRSTASERLRSDR